MHSLVLKQSVKSKTQNMILKYIFFLLDYLFNIYYILYRYLPKVLEVNIQGHGEMFIVLQHLPLKVLQEHLILLHVVHSSLTRKNISC
jgi:hypothetical protein